VVAGFGLDLAEFAMDGATLFGKLTSGIAVRDGRASVPEAPGAGFEAIPDFAEIFGGLLNRVCSN
jgi:hypothetical protein